MSQSGDTSYAYDKSPCQSEADSKYDPKNNYEDDMDNLSQDTSHVLFIV